jgi:hypothetical protein
LKGELTVEQQFEIAKLKQQIEHASAEQLRVLFVEFYTIMLLKDNATKALLAHHWGIEHVTD